MDSPSRRCDYEKRPRGDGRVDVLKVDFRGVSVGRATTGEGRHPPYNRFDLTAAFHPYSITPLSHKL